VFTRDRDTWDRLENIPFTVQPSPFRVLPVYAFVINHRIESGRPQRVNLMLRNGIVTRRRMNQVLMVESANANNGIWWFRGVSVIWSRCYFKISQLRRHTERTVLLEDLKFWTIKVIIRNLISIIKKLIARISKFFAALFIIFEVSTKLFWRSNKISFRSVSSKILDPSARSLFLYVYHKRWDIFNIFSAFLYLRMV